jgi:hypothetical protein
MEQESDTATLESEATKEYLAEEAENIKRAEMSSRPPNWRDLQLNDPRIGQEFAIPEFNTEEGMRVRGLLDEKGDATPFGEDYLMLEDRGLFKDGRMTQKGVAFTTPTEDLLPTSKMDAGTMLDPNDPENLEQFSKWKIREEARLNEKPEDEGNAIMNIFKGIGEMGKSIIAVTASPLGGLTLDQRTAAIAKIAEGAAETAVTSSGKLGAFLDKNVINPARKALGATDEQIKVDNLWGKFVVDTRDALYEDVTAEKTWDALTATTQAVEMRARASEDYTRQFGPVDGARKMAEMDRGAYAAGGMVTDVPALAVGALTVGGGKLLSLGRTIKTAKFAKEAAAASTNLGRLGEASTLIAKNIDEATASASVFQKQLNDALLVGNTEAAGLAKSQLDNVTATIGESQTRLGLVSNGIKHNEGIVQSASTKIDDLNAPSMVGRKITSGAAKKVADAADALGNGFLWTNRKLRAIERGIGMGRLPYLVHAAGVATLGTAYKVYGAIRVGSLVASPLLKKAAAFSNIVGDEMLQLTNSSPFWRRVAANEEAGRMTQAFGGLMDYTTPITRGVVGAAKGTAHALPAMTLYEAINSQGLDENAMERAGAGAFVFGSFGRVIGSRNNWNQVKNNEFYNFRNKVKATNPEGFQQFESVPYRDVKQFASSIDAAYPGMFDSWRFVKDGNSKFDPVNKQATINYNDRAGIVKAAAAHEALHGIQFKHQSDGAVASLMLGDETRKGLVRNTDGSLDPEFKQFWDEYNSRLDAQGLPKIDINDAAIEYFTDNGAQTLFEDVLGGGLYKASQKTPLRRSIESVFKSTMAATPIVKNLHFKLGGATDNLGRMVDGSGLLAKGMKELPEVKAMIRNMYRESAGLPKQAPKPQIIKDAPSQDPKHYKGGEIIRKANEEAVQGGTPLPDNVLNPDANGNGFGYLTDGAIKGLEKSGVIADGDFAGVIAINSSMGTPSSYLLTNKPIEQGRSVQVEGITSNNIVPINWELKNGRLYLVGMDMVQLKLNIAKAAKSSIAKKLGMKYADILNDIDNSALLHAKNQTTDAYFQSKDPKNWEKRKNFINSVQGLLTESQKKTNPLFDKRNLNKTSGIYRTFAWDRLGDKIQMTGEVAVPYGQNSYYSLRDNLMPQFPRMNRNRELVIEIPPISKGKKSSNSISLLLSGAASHQMQREDQNENNYQKLQSNVIASVEDSLSNQERKKTLSVLGENSWNYNTSGKFVEQIADWVVSPKSVSPRLHEIISKTWSGLSKKLNSNTAVVSLRSSLAPRGSIRKVPVMKSLPVSAPVDYDGKIEIPKYSPTTDESKQIPIIKSSLYASDDEQLPTIIPSANLEEIPKIKDPAKNNEIIASSISAITSEWIVKNKDNNDAPFAIADKNNGSIMFFNKNGHLVSSVPALFGRKKGDDIITTGEVSHRTPAGRFDAKRYDSEDYGPSLRFDRVGTNNFLIHRIPSKSITATPEQRRKALKSQDAQDNRITSGCINLDPDAVPGAISHFENGGILYILPETNEGKSKSSAFRNIPQIKNE